MNDCSADGLATLVGSMPHRDREAVIRLILEKVSSIPVWPQLAHYPAEGMMVQYLEGLPALCRTEDKTWIATEGAEFDRELLEFYTEYLALEEDPGAIDHSRFAMGAETGRTFIEFVRAVKEAPPSHAVKGQVTGPFTLLSGLKDENNRACLYNDHLRELIPKHLAMKARWQISHLRSCDRPVIIFIDEPALAGFGSSAFISVSAQQVHDLLEEVIVGIQQAGAVAGVHICANTDWNLVFDSSINIINFDAYHYLDRFLLYLEPLRRFIAGNGIVAWGMVPTTGDGQALQETPETLAERWQKAVEPLLESGLTLEEIVSHSLFTPSCGCGTLSEQRAEEVVEITCELSRLIRAKVELA